MSSTSSSRAPLVLLLVVAAGLGVRAASASHAAPDSSANVAPLDSQITRVRSAALRSPAPKTKRARKGSASAPSLRKREGEGEGGEGGAGAFRSAAPIRSEQTPFGALPAERVERDRQSPNARPAPKSQPVRPALRGAPSVVVNVEIATAEEVESLPGIGPSLARRIIEDRRLNGPFGSLEGLQRVRGVGPVLAARLAGRVTFNVAGRP